MSYTVLVSDMNPNEHITRFNLWISEDGMNQLIEKATSFRNRRAAQDAIYAIRDSRKVGTMPYKKTKFTIYENYGTPECRNVGSTIYED